MKASELCVGQRKPALSASSHPSGGTGIPRIPGHRPAGEPGPPAADPAGCSIPTRQRRLRAPSSAPTNPTNPPALVPGGFEASPGTCSAGGVGGGRPPSGPGSFVFFPVSFFFFLKPLEEMGCSAGSGHPSGRGASLPSPGRVLRLEPRRSCPVEKEDSGGDDDMEPKSQIILRLGDAPGGSWGQTCLKFGRGGPSSVAFLAISGHCGGFGGLLYASRRFWQGLMAALLLRAAFSPGAHWESGTGDPQGWVWFSGKYWSHNSQKHKAG